MEQEYRDNWYAFVIFMLTLLPVELAFERYYRDRHRATTADGEWISMLVDAGFMQCEIARANKVTQSRISHIFRKWRDEQEEKYMQRGTVVNLEQLKEEIQRRLIGTKITILSVDRKCGRLDVKYKKGKSTNTLNFYITDKNDPAGCIAGEIMLEEC